MGHWGVKKVCVHKFMNLDLKLINHVHKFIVSNIYNIVDILLCVGKTSKTEQHILFKGQNYKCSFASIWRHCVIVDITERKKYIYCLPSCSINLCIRFQWFYSIRLFFLLHTKYKITHTNNFKYKNFLKMGQTFYVKKKNLKCISCMIYNLVDPLHPLIGSYLRDVEEEEKTLMRKRASAPGW